MVGSPFGDGEVVRKFSGSRGDLMAKKDSEDEGGVIGVRYAIRWVAGVGTMAQS